MSSRRFQFLGLVLCSALAVVVHAQDEHDAQLIEEDHRVTSVEDRQRAVTDLRNQADELRKAGQMIEAARTLIRVGGFQIRMSVPQEAVATFQEARKLAEAQADAKTQIDSLNGLASSYDYLSQCRLTEPLANEAIDLSRQHNYVAGQAEGLLILSDCQNYRDHVLALKTAQESLELWRSINRKRGMAETFEVISHYQILQYNLVECSKSTEAALSIYRELNDVDEQASALIYLALIEHRKGAWQNALALYTQVQSMIDEKAEPYKMGQIAYGLGDTFLESGLPELALDKFREGLELFSQIKNQRGVSILKWSIGRALYLSGHYQQALESLETARDEAQANKDVTLTAFCEDYLGRTYDALADHTAALEHFQAALDAYSRAKNTMEVARTQALIGQVYQRHGNFTKARENYQTALATFRRLSDVVNESAVLYALGNLELRADNLVTAEEYLRQSIDVTEQMRRVSTSSDLTAAVSATVHDRYESYIECLMRQHQAHPERGFALKAFETSELARARSLTDLLRATQTNLAPGLDPQLAEQEKSLRQSLRVKEDYKVALLGRDYKKEELAVLTAELNELETKYKGVTDAIRARYPAYDQMSRPRAWDLNQIQQQVIADDQTVLLEYSLGVEHSYVWAVSRNGINSYELPAQARITEAAQKLYKLLTVAGDAQKETELTQAAQELSGLILSPVAAELNKQRVIVVADGALNYIPFQLLTAPNRSGEPLVASYEVINVPSASILGELRQETSQRHAPTNLLAAFGDPVFASNYAQQKGLTTNEQIAALQTPENETWSHALRDIEPAGDSVDPSSIQPLIYAARELANLRTLAGPDSLMVTGFDATRENLAHLDLTKYAILHFATHGVLDPKRPESSGLFLSMVDRKGKAQNGFVGLQDIYALHAPVDLVVLSACRTGLGKDVRGEGLIGLTRGFMYAGASSVLASLWKVDDEATSELMKRFYSNMLQGQMTPAAALRAAQNSIRQEPQWRSPYYWAAFTLQGEFRQVIKRASDRSLTGTEQIRFALSVVLLWGTMAWWYRRSAVANQRAA